METTAARTSATGGFAAQVAWAIGASTASTVVSNVVLMAVGGLGMFVVMGLRLDRAVGIPVYLAALALGAVGYGAIVHGGLVRAGRRTSVPWIVWPALAAWPVTWILVSVFADPAGVLEPTPAVIAAIGTLGAWFTLGRNRWSAR